MIRTLAIILALALLVAINFNIWSYINNPLQLEPWTSTTMGVTFDPTKKDETDKTKRTLTYSEEDIDNDLALSVPIAFCKACIKCLNSLPNTISMLR
jgi:hypothetical protein